MLAGRSGSILARQLSSLEWPLASVLALDIGGSLTKLVLRSPEGVPTSKGQDSHARPWAVPGAQASDSSAMFVSKALQRMPRHPGFRPELEIADGAGGALSFLQFETRWMPDFVDILHELGMPQQRSDPDLPIIPATGGGAFKFADLFRDRLGVQLVPYDEMMCLSRGMRYFEAAALGSARGGQQPGLEAAEMFTFDLARDRMIPWRDPAVTSSDAAPSCLLVQIGSGTSVIRLTRAEGGKDQIDRVNGCSVGGATFWGLCRLLTSYRTFDEAIESTAKGDNTKVAMLVSDIYGGGYNKIGLPGDIVAADFGKISVRRSPRAPSGQGGGKGGEPAIEDADLTRALLVMVLNNIAQVANSSAKEHSIDRIFFGGSFLRKGTMMRILTSALKYWSGGRIRAAFLRHEGYFGAMGAMLQAAQAESAGLARIPLPGDKEWRS
jgi:pantothenate kinase